MKTYHIPLKSLIPKGKVTLTMNDKELHMTTLEEGLSKKHQNFAYLPDSYNLPFRIDMRLSTNSPQFKLKIGNGHIMFTGSLNRSGRGIRRADIFTGREEQTKYDYDNLIPINEYVDISVIYGNQKMWVELNGQYCYCSGKASYLKLLDSNTIPEELMEGLGFAVVCDEKVEIKINSLAITEYENNEPHMPDEVAGMQTC